MLGLKCVCVDFFLLKSEYISRYQSGRGDVGGYSLQGDSLIIVAFLLACLPTSDGEYDDDDCFLHLQEMLIEQNIAGCL